jgi:hypothetical protein
MVVVAVEPVVPVTTPVPREVVTDDPTLGDCDPVTPPVEELCAAATPVIIARAVVAANQNLSMSCSPVVCQQVELTRPLPSMWATHR